MSAVVSKRFILTFPEVLVKFLSRPFDFLAESAVFPSTEPLHDVLLVSRHPEENVCETLIFPFHQRPRRVTGSDRKAGYSAPVGI